MSHVKGKLSRQARALGSYGTLAGTETVAVSSSDGETHGEAALSSFALTTLDQTIGGIKTFSSMFRIPVGGDVAAAGSAQGDATALLEGFQVVTGADGTKGVILPTAVAGAIVIIKGTTAGVLKVYPATGAAINAVAANGAFSLASGAIPAIFIAKTATQWYSIPLVPS